MNKPKATNQNILQEIKQKKILPIYLLCGEEKFLIEGTLTQILDQLLNPATRDFNLSFLDGSQTSIKDAIADAELCPMMADWRVVVVREPQLFQKQKKQVDPTLIIKTALKESKTDPSKAVYLMANLLENSITDILNEEDNFKQNLQSLEVLVSNQLNSEEQKFIQQLPTLALEVDLSGTKIKTDEELLFNWLEGSLPKSSVLVLVVKDNVNLNKKIVKQIEKVGRVVSFANLIKDRYSSNNPLYKKIRQKLEQHGKTITSKACKLLVERSDGDMYEISKSITKIIDLIGPKKEITDQEIELIVTQQNFDNIFDLTDAIGTKSLEKALKSLYEVVMSGEPAIKINSLIIRQFRLVLQAKLLYKHKEDIKPITSRTNYSTFKNSILGPLTKQLTYLLPEARELNVLKQNPYAAYKIFQAVPKFSEKELIDALEKLLEVDQQLKSSDLPDITILEQMICELWERTSS